MPPALKIRGVRTAQKRRRAFTTKPRERKASTLPELRGPCLRSCRAIVPRLRDEGGFTLLELLTVVGLIAILLVLLTPAFTNLKSAGDVTNAADTIKGVLERARNYAMANNTYTWV